MKTYLGCKVVKAQQMDLDTFNSKFSKVIPADGHSKDGYHVRYPDGYNSWSPKAVFESAYREFSSEEMGLIKT